MAIISRRTFVKHGLGIPAAAALAALVPRSRTALADDVDVTLDVVPNFKQRNGTSCGRTSAAMALAYYGELAGEDEMESPRMRSTFENLIAINDYVAGGPRGLAEGFGRYTDGRIVGHYWSTDRDHWIEALWFNVAIMKRPVICLIPKAQNVGSVSSIPHYIVVDGFASERGGTVAFCDPTTYDEQQRTWKEFGFGWGKSELWSGTTIHGYQAVDVRRWDDRR